MNNNFKVQLLAASLSIKRKRLMESSCRLSRLSVCRSVCRSVRKVYCGKTVDCIRMPFGMVSGVGRGMVVLDGGGDAGKGHFYE